MHQFAIFSLAVGIILSKSKAESKLFEYVNITAYSPLESSYPISTTTSRQEKKKKHALATTRVWSVLTLNK